MKITIKAEAKVPYTTEIISQDIVIEIYQAREETDKQILWAAHEVEDIVKREVDKEMEKRPGKYVTKESSPERDRICAESYMNQDGSSQRNSYGELFWVDDEYPNGIPVICGHGGSAWLCRACKDKSMQEQNEKLSDSASTTSDSNRSPKI